MTQAPNVRAEPTPVPDKCAGATGAGITPNPCTEPGSLPRCQLCPKSPTYWRKQEPSRTAQSA